MEEGRRSLGESLLGLMTSIVQVAFKEGNEQYIESCKVSPPNNATTCGSSTNEERLKIQVLTIYLDSGQVMTNAYSMICMDLMCHIFKGKKCVYKCRFVKGNYDRRFIAL